MIEPADGAVAQGRVYQKQLTGAIGWDVEAMENASGDSQILSLVTGKWDRFLNGFLAVLNAVDFGDGTGRLARVASNTDNTTYYTVVVDNTAQDFFVDGLALVENGMLVDILTVNTIVDGAAWTKKVIRGEVYGVNKTALSFNVRAISGVTNSALTAVPVDGDFVFISGAVTLDSDVHWNSWDLPMGLHGILDDGGAAGNEFDDGTGYFNGSYYGVTWQNLDRSANALFRARVLRPADWSSASTNATHQAATLETLFSLFDDLYASGDTPDPEKQIVICSPASGRWLERRVVAEQNGMQEIPANGHVLAGLVNSGFRVTAGRREIIVPVKTDMAVPNGTFLVPDMGRIGTWEKMPLSPISQTGDVGAVQIAEPGGRKLNVERWARQRSNLFTPNCRTSGRLDGVDIAA
jgi:hypothetical protein